MMRPRQKTGRKKSFTLIELLLVVTILSVVSLAMYAVFNNGIKIWQKINQQLPQEDAAIFLDKFCRDIRNSFEFTGIPFSGRENELSFATLVNSNRLKNTGIGCLTYSYDSQSQALTRKQEDYPQIYSVTFDAGVLQALNNIRSLKFQYYFFNPETNEYFWKQEWVNDSLPLAVNVELEIDDGSKLRKFIQTVSIPVAG